jgi:hypothetical protein
MKVNTTPIKDDFCPLCDVCDRVINENPVHYLELDSDGVQTRFGSRERHYVHQGCIQKFSLYSD